MAGSPPYMAPEQAEGRVAEVSFGADVYALGAMLYRLLSGRAPYAPRQGHEEPEKTVELIRRGPPTPLQRLVPEAPAELVAISERAMAREPEDRYASVADLARDLHAFLAGRARRRRDSHERGGRASHLASRARCELGAFEGAGAPAPALRRRAREPRAARAALPARDREPRRMVLARGARPWRSAAARRTSSIGAARGSTSRRRPGDAASAAVLLEDVRRFRAHAGLDALVLVGLSWGGKLALAAALDQPEGVRAVVLVTPGLVAARRLLVAAAARHRAQPGASAGATRFHVPIEPEMFTRTPRYLDYIANDPLRLKRVTARFLLASRVLDRTIRARLHTLHVPVLLLLAGHDRIIDNERTLELLERLPGRMPAVRARTTGATHSIQFEETDALVRDVSRFLEEVAC